MDINRLRPIVKKDIPALKSVLKTIELFPPNMLEGMLADYLDNPKSQDLWFTATDENDIPISLGYCAPEKLTVGTYNLYAIGVKSDIQGKGIGSKMIQYIEDELIKKEKRVLIIDTSGKKDFARTRKFYKNLDYNQEAVIRDFWDEGDDKVVFRKRL